MAKQYRKTLGLIEVSWQTYLEKVVPENACDIQRRECKRAFFAGAVVAMSVLKEVGEREMNEDRGAAILEDVDCEIKQFIRRELSDSMGAVSLN